MKKIELNLDYPKVLADRTNEVHLAVGMEAQKLKAKERGPVAFCVCLDRSGSMQGEKFEYAKQACMGVVESLQGDDLFSLVTFDNDSEVVIPLGKIKSKSETIEQIRKMEVQGMTNLSGGWQDARAQLRKAEPNLLRRMLLLSDGMTNRGEVDHEELIKMARAGLMEDEVRTTCLGFGDHYNEDLLKDMAAHGTGNFYDVDVAGKLPAVFAAELDSALHIAVKKLRVRFRPSKRCKEWKFLGALPTDDLGDCWHEFMAGDMGSEETRACALRMLLEPMSKKGKVLELKFIYDLVTEEGTREVVEEKKVKVEVTSNKDEVTINLGALKVTSAQRSADVIRQAIDLMDEGRDQDALNLMEEMVNEFMALNQPELVSDAIGALEGTIKKIRDGWSRVRGRKFASYGASSFSKMSSKEVWSVNERDMSMPSFKQSSLKDYGYKGTDDEL